jgi:hypothetical protein
MSPYGCSSLQSVPALNNGTDCNEVQPLNMLAKFVPFAVFNNGTDCNEEQYWNMEAKFVPFAVFNAGTDCNEEQP